MEMRLLELDIGKTAVVKSIGVGEVSLRSLEALGVRVGQIFRKVGSGPFRSPVVIEVDRARIAIGKKISMKILVEEVQQ